MLKKFITKIILSIIFILNLYGSDKELQIQKLLNSYPNFLKSYSNNKLIWNDNSKTIYDDFIKKNNFDELLNNASIKDQMSQKYIKVSTIQSYFPSLNEDPGRIRNESFFRKMYGSTKDEIKTKLVEIHWMPKTTNKILLVTTVNNIDKKLQNISNELDKLPNDLKNFVNNPSGTFTFRTIAGTSRLSMHSFGAAIDINVNKSHYWRWDKKKDNFNYKNQIPLEIVKIFEKNGFIWGGRWYHYDTMHFEYRPELLLD